MLSIDALKEYGANTAEGLARCMNNEAFYLRLVGTLKDEKGFDSLKSSIESGDLKGAFESAHSLKGVLGNLSITPLYQLISEITELLRSGTQMDYTEIVSKIETEKSRFFSLFD